MSSGDLGLYPVEVSMKNWGFLHRVYGNPHFLVTTNSERMPSLAPLLHFAGFLDDIFQWCHRLSLSSIRRCTVVSM